MLVATTIDVPTGTAKVRVSGGTQSICATGTSSRGSVYPTAVVAIVYTTPTSPPPAPPPGVTAGTVDGSGAWSFRGSQEIPGVNSSNMTPYPTNFVCVWAQYNDQMMPYDMVSTSFLAESSNQTDCDT
jgi:hypothetical protein